MLLYHPLFAIVSERHLSLIAFLFYFPLTPSDHFPIREANTIYGRGNGSILLDDLMCTGNEESLIRCNRRPLFENDCASDHSEDAGVICNGKLHYVHTFLVN